MFLYLKKRGQSTLEYAIIIAVVVGALISAQIYIKRGLMGRYKQATDDIGEQWSARASTYDYTIVSSSSSTETTRPHVVGSETMSMTTSRVTQEQTRTGTEYISDYDDADESWDK